MWRSDRHDGSQPRQFAAGSACRPEARSIAAPGRWLRVAATLAVTVLMSACALAPRLPSSPTLLEYSGRFSVSWRTDSSENNAQRSAGRFLLRVDGPRSELEVSSPLGQTLAVVNVTPGAATLVTADGARFSAGDAQTLTEQAFGWPAPLAQLPQWLAGTTHVAGAPAATTLAGGGASPEQEPTRFVDSNWQVSVEAWQAGVPRRLVLRWPATALPEGASGAIPPAGAPGATSRPIAREVELRLVVDETPGAADRR